jgi:hypothetical protein
MDHEESSHDGGKRRRRPEKPLPTHAEVMAKATYEVADMASLIHTTRSGWHKSKEGGGLDDLPLTKLNRRWLCEADDFWAWFRTHRQIPSEMPDRPKNQRR